MFFLQFKSEFLSAYSLVLSKERDVLGIFAISCCGFTLVIPSHGISSSLAELAESVYKSHAYVVLKGHAALSPSAPPLPWCQFVAVKLITPICAHLLVTP